MFTLVVSFCNEQYMEITSPITLDAYQPSFSIIYVFSFFYTVLSFCNEQHVENTSITLDGFLHSFGAISSFCMCEVKILSTQTFSSLRVSQESTLIPPEDCGLQIEIANATQTIRTVQCSDIGDTEYILYQGSSIVISLTKVTENWREGFCFHLSMRFGKYIALNYSTINFFLWYIKQRKNHV